MILRVDHIGIAVNSIEDAVKLYSDVLGLKVTKIQNHEVNNVRLAMIPVGESNIELLESTDPEGPIAKFIKKRGEGIHHLALEVSDIQGMIRTLKEEGVLFIKTLKEEDVPLADVEPITGFSGSRIVFLDPKGTKVLIELVEH